LEENARRGIINGDVEKGGREGELLEGLGDIGSRSCWYGLIRLVWG
jgi:hypothetical protein